ncbi:MAG: hypothetical protein K6A35_09640 [bacterium]|nr:hypothetical protein [bacterium]
MNKSHLNFTWASLLGCTLMLGALSSPLHAETATENAEISPEQQGTRSSIYSAAAHTAVSMNSAIQAAKFKDNTTQPKVSPASQPPTPTETLLAQASPTDLEERLNRQQELLDKQSQFIEEQQKQIDELRSQVEVLRQAQSASAAQTEAPAVAGSPEADNQNDELNAQADSEASKPDSLLTDSQTEPSESTIASGQTEESSEGTLAAQADAEENGETEDPGPLPPSADETLPEATAQASGQQPDLNPNISFIVLGGAQLDGAAGDEKKGTFFINEAELQISAPVDPNTRLEGTFSAGSGHGLEMEEAYAQYMGFKDLQIRGGKFRNEFGALNNTHTHALPQIDRPLPYTELLGEEGLGGAGVELSYLLPVPWYSKATVSATTRAGEEEEDEEAFALFPGEGKHNPILTARWENMADLNDDTTLTLGLSHASSAINGNTVKSAQINGADLTLKWHPAKDTYKEFVWRSEYMNARQKYQEPAAELPEGLDPETAEPVLKNKDLSGWYSYVSYRLNRNLRLGARYDQVDSPLVEDGSTKRVSAIAEYILNEWNSLQLQYNHVSPSWSDDYNEIKLQWNLVIGPHGAHKY